MSKQEFRPNKLSQGILLLADSVAADNYIGTQRMGRLPIDAPAYLRRQALMARASDAELLNLTHSPNAVAQLVAFEGLYERGHPDVLRVLDRLSKQERVIQYIRGDISSRIPALEYAYVYVLAYPLSGESLPQEISPKEPKYPLPELKRAEIEALIRSQRAKIQ